MHFYSFNIGDYLSHTGHLSPMEDLAYRRMIDLYYLKESPLPVEPSDVAKLIRLRDEAESVASILAEYFEPTESGWIHARCDYEISEASSRRNKAAESAKLRWQREHDANAMRTHSEGNATPIRVECEGNAPTPTPNPTPIPKVNLKPSGAYSNEFEEAWKAYPRRPGANKKEAYNAWKARLKAGTTCEAMYAGTVRYAAYCQAKGTDPEYVKQPATFYGPADHYLSDWVYSIPRDGPVSYAQQRDESRRNTHDILTGKGRNYEHSTPIERDITNEAKLLTG